MSIPFKSIPEESKQRLLFPTNIFDLLSSHHKGNAHTINTDDKEILRQQMNVKMEEEDSKEIYKNRKVIVESVFGHIKNAGFRGFSVKG